VTEIAVTEVFLSPSQPVPTALAQVDREKIYQWINELSSPETRENALLELSKKRESVPDLAPMLWHSFGTIAALLQVGRAELSFVPWHSAATLQSSVCPWGGSGEALIEFLRAISVYDGCWITW